MSALVDETIRKNTKKHESANPKDEIFYL